MQFHIEIDREDDGRWIAEVPDLPGVMVYGRSREDAVTNVAPHPGARGLAGLRLRLPRLG